MDTLLLLALNGLIWGLIIALIALGLSIIFGLLDIINIAHGDFFMVGTVLAWFTLELTGNFWAAFLIVPLIGFILGALIQRVVIQPIRNVAALTIVATFGLSLILQNLLAVSGEPVSVWSWLLGVGSLIACVALALAWAAWQFRREAVLFRGEEGPSLRAWWRMMTKRE